MERRCIGAALMLSVLGAAPIEVPLRHGGRAFRATTPMLSVVEEAKALPPEAVTYRFDVHLNTTLAVVPTTYLESLHPYNWAYFLTVVFPGAKAQAMDVVLDTGSKGLSVPAGSVEGWPPGGHYNTLDIHKADVEPLHCDDPRCHAHCKPGDIEADFTCGPHGGACLAQTNFSVCGFVFQYADNSYNAGLIMMGPVGLAGRWVNSTMGLIIGSTALYYELWRGNGILGVADYDYEALGFPYTSFVSPIDDMIQQYSLPNIITLCFHHRDAVMTIGGGNSAQYDGELKYSPLLDAHGKFQVAVVDIQLDGKSVMPSGHRYLRPGTGSALTATIDTGDTGLGLPPAVYRQFEQQGRAAVADIPRLTEGPRNIFNLTAMYIAPEVIARFPVVTILLDGGVKFTLPPQQYFVEVWAPESVSTVPLHSLRISSSTSSGADMMIGTAVLHRVYMELDRAGKRVGFAPSKEGCRSS